MPALQIPDLDQKTMTVLRRWAADRGRTIEDAARAILQGIAARIDFESSDPETTRPMTELDDTGQSRGAASLQPMYLSVEDAALMQDAWEKGLARPKIAIAPLQQYKG